MKICFSVQNILERLSEERNHDQTKSGTVKEIPIVINYNLVQDTHNRKVPSQRTQAHTYNNDDTL